MTAITTRLLTPADYRTMPWRNGQGVTTEIAAAPDAPAQDAGGSPAPPFRWRVSIAEVAASGPFSDFTGYDRTLTVIAGAGLCLDFAAAAEPLMCRPLVPVRFDGGRPAEGRLIDGPVRDFNVMTDRRLADHHVAVLAPADDRPLRHDVTGRVTLVHVLAGPATVEPAATLPRRVAPGETLRLDREAPGAPLRLGISGPDALVLVVEIRPPL